MSTAYLGIDPGQEGSIAVIWPNGTCTLYPLDGKELTPIKGFLDGIVATAANKGCTIHATIEKVGPMPTDSRKGAFAFGHITGALKMALIMAGIGIQQEPTPQMWRKVIWKGRGEPKGDALKDAAREEVNRLYPGKVYERDKHGSWAVQPFTYKNTHNKAEAVLLAHYGRLASLHERSVNP